MEQINGQRLGKGQCKLLYDWNIIGFGPPKDPAAAKEDYREHRMATVYVLHISGLSV